MTRKTVYVIYGYDTLPYSDMSDYYFKAFLSESKAKEFIENMNTAAHKEMDEWQFKPDMLYDYRAIDLEE